MSEIASAQAEVDVLNAEYEVYVRELRREWFAKNQPRVDSGDVYEVMRPDDKARVRGCIDRWKKYITPIAETWWKERGYGVVWLDDDSKPMQLYRLGDD